MMQHLVDHNRIHTGIVQGQAVDGGSMKPDAARRLGFLELGAGDPQHVLVHVDRVDSRHVIQERQ